MRIGDVAGRSGVSARMLRHYDALGLVRPSGRTSTGYREYSPDDIRRIFHVESLRSLGLSLKEIGRALDDPAFVPADLVADLIARTEQRIRMESELLGRLRHVAATGPDAWEEVLGAVSLLTELGARSSGARQQAALGAVGEHVPVDALAGALLQEENLNVAGALRWALAHAQDVDAAPFVAALESADPGVRRQAIDTLAALPGRAQHLRAALAHRDPDVRAVAALALGDHADPSAVPELVRMVVAGDRDVPAGEALGEIATATEDPALIVRALTDALAGDYSVRQRLVQALAEIPGAAADRELAALATDDDPRIAHTAAFILRQRADH